MKKDLYLRIAAGAAAGMLFYMCPALSSYAGQWLEDSTGWRYLDDSGSYLAGCWSWIDGNGDNIAECYYFNDEGYILTDTLTPDGYAVDGSGAWTVSGIVQTEEAETSGDAAGTSDAAAKETSDTADAGGISEDALTISADEAIKSVKTLGQVYADGAKPYAIAVEYGVDLSGATVDASMYDVWDFWMDMAGSLELGSDPGAVKRVYINDTASADTSGNGSSQGNYVIIELNTDYQVSVSQTYYLSMAAAVSQVGTLDTGTVTVTPGSGSVTNYDTVTYTAERPGGRPSEEVTENRARDGGYTIDGVDLYSIGVYHAESCFDEATGAYGDLDLDYALYVPGDYDVSKKYMLVLHIEDAGALGDDAMLVLTEAQTPMNLVSDDMQQYAKDQGYGGIIVLCPQITEEYRSARDNYTVSAALQATWKLLDYVTGAYNIDMDRIYGTGQSMGGMQVMQMAAQRDNYFAALMPVGCQWGSNYNKEDEYNGASYYETPVDGVYVLSVDAAGNPCDYRNFYYMLSDDNILCLNCADDSFSSTVWKEWAYLYADLAGISIPYTSWNPLTLDVTEQEKLLEEFVSSDNATGIYWAAFEGGSHMSTWVYADRIDAIYKWMLSKTASGENERGKISVLANEFEPADEQLETEERLIASDESSGSSWYFVTGKPGAGTAGYNSGLYSMNGGAPTRVPGWKPAE